MSDWPLGTIGREQFLEQYWQQKPCLIRQAFAGFESPISPEELAGLACETEIHARLIFEQLGDKSWQCINGPFSEEDFHNLPDQGYSLLVSNCEEWIPECFELMQRFRFIPDWRIDDVMISYAPDGGSVGPHLDQYDVFLLQTWGKRRWMLDPSASQDSAHLANTDLRILEQFRAQQDWLLEPGDMLYLPPGLAHYGVADGPCMTWSIGFRALSEAQIVEACTRELLEHEQQQRRYTDVDLLNQSHPAAISPAQLQRFRQILLNSLQMSDAELASAIGKRLTETSDSMDFDVVSETADTLPLPAQLFRPLSTRCCFFENEDNLQVFVAGHSFNLSHDLRPALDYICDQHQYDLKVMQAWLQHDDFAQMLHGLWRHGLLESDSE